MTVNYNGIDNDLEESRWKDMESRNLDYTYDNLRQEIHRAYMVLGEQAEMQNDMDIDRWFNDGLICVLERDSLKRYNRNMWKRMVAEEGV